MRHGKPGRRVRAHPPRAGRALEPGLLFGVRTGFPTHLGPGLGQHSPDAQTCQQKGQSGGGLGSPWEVVLAQALAAGLVHGLPLGKGPE